MLNNIKKIYSIAFFTAKEIIKSKILLNVLMLGVALMVVTYVAFSFTYGEAARVALDFGLGMLSISSVGIAIFIGVGLLSKEIENRTVYMIISRPVPRYAFILGKLLGLITVLVLNIVLLASLTILCYFLAGGEYNSLILLSILFTIIESIIVLLFVCVMSLLTSPTLSVLLTIMTYISGHAISETKLTSFAKHAPGLMEALNFYHFVLPGFYKLNIKDFILYKQTIEISYISNTIAYGIVYSLFLTTLAILIFERKNLD
jgi:ABC-type transport system involved in multi-copper enzyme maturation permease subunit